MLPHHAFIEAKKTFERCVRGNPLRPVLLGLDGSTAKFRRGPVEMHWRFVDARTPEDVLLAAREVRDPLEVLVVPRMTRLGAAACIPYDVSWCDGEGRCNVGVVGPGWFEHVHSWHPSPPPPDFSLFASDIGRRVLGLVAGSPRGSVHEVIQDAGYHPRAVEALAFGGPPIFKRSHNKVSMTSKRAALVTLELLAMPEDPLSPPDPETSARMARIRTRDTHPELNVRRALHARGVRYRTHVADLPGTPDFANKGDKWAFFVHGCFWHAHDCDEFRPPRRNADFWARKFAATRERDARVEAELRAMGYEVHVMWGCEITEATDETYDELARELLRR